MHRDKRRYDVLHQTRSVSRNMTTLWPATSHGAPSPNVVSRSQKARPFKKLGPCYVYARSCYEYTRQCSGKE